MQNFQQLSAAWNEWVQTVGVKTSRPLRLAQRVSAGGQVKRFSVVEDRAQVTLLPECLDDYVAEDNPVRAVKVFVEKLDLPALGCKGADPAAASSPHSGAW